MLMTNSIKIYAATSLEQALLDLQNGANNGDDLGGFISIFLKFALPLSGLCVFLLVSMAAYKLMTSRGNPDKLQEARDQISNAVIGFLFVILSVAILALLADVLKINID